MPRTPAEITEAALAWWRSARLPPGAMVKLYFGGEMEFGLPPTAIALDAYLEFRRGGHVRVGLEDYAGPGEPSSLDLLRAAVAIIEGLGRAPATTVTAENIQLAAAGQRSGYLQPVDSGSGSTAVSARDPTTSPQAFASGMFELFANCSSYWSASAGTTGMSSL